MVNRIQTVNNVIVVPLRRDGLKGWLQATHIIRFIVLLYNAGIILSKRNLWCRPPPVREELMRLFGCSWNKLAIIASEDTDDCGLERLRYTTQFFMPAGSQI